MERALKVFEHKNNVIDHFECIRNIFGLYTSRERLQELRDLEDVDKICAFEYHRMKDHALNQEGLQIQEYHPEHFRDIKIPDLDLINAKVKSKLRESTTIYHQKKEEEVRFSKVRNTKLQHSN